MMPQEKGSVRSLGKALELLELLPWDLILRVKLLQKRQQILL